MLRSTDSGTSLVFEGPLGVGYPRNEPIAGTGAWGGGSPGDFTGDGVLDVAYRNGAIAVGPLGYESTVSTTITMDEPADEVISGDFDGDGQLD